MRGGVLAALLLLGAGGCGRSAEAEAQERLRAEREAAEAKNAALEERVRALEAELALARAARVQREEEWLRYTQAIAKLSSAAEKPAATFEPAPEAVARAAGPLGSGAAGAAGAAGAPDSHGALGAAATGSAPDPDAEAALRRDQEVLRSLRALLDLEQVTGFDLLEAGSLREGATGPVVLRALDDRGRPVGTLAAERLRLEGSRSARTLTLVLERGYERRGGERHPFPGPVDAEGRGAEKRIDLPFVDPGPWIEALPELFPETERVEPQDDGSFDLGAVRAALNLLLREDAANGWWRVAALGGVQGGVMRDVQLDGLDRDGRIERKLFADRMQVHLQDRGLMVLLEGGAQVRGDEKTPFLEGRYRIFLPRADPEAWAKAGIPGQTTPARPATPATPGEQRPPR